MHTRCHSKSHPNFIVAATNLAKDRNDNMSKIFHQAYHISQPVLCSHGRPCVNVGVQADGSPSPP